MTPSTTRTVYTTWPLNMVIACSLPDEKRGGFGHHYLSPHRRFAVDLLENGGYARFHQQRTQIERNFRNWTSFGGGLSPLPNWVRRLDRIRLWIQAK